jgi:heme exporter protein C
VGGGVVAGHPEHTGSRLTRLVGALTLAGFAAVLVLALVVSPPDQVQGDAARLIYVHVPVAIVMNLAFGLTAIGSAMWLWKKSRWFDTLAVASAEVGVVFTGLTLLTGMIWGRPTWGVYWTWDARLTSSLLLFLMYLGYLVVRRLPSDVDVRNRRSAFVALLSFVDVPIVYYSVSWWRSLHQSATLSLHTTISGTMLFTLFVSMVVFVVCFAWLLIHRFRVAWLEDEVEASGLASAIDERRAEAFAT